MKKAVREFVTMALLGVVTALVLWIVAGILSRL